MASLSERIRNVFRNEMVMPVPEKTAQDIQMDNERVQAKINEGFKMGVGETIKELSEGVLNQRSTMASEWEQELASRWLHGAEHFALSPDQIDQQYTLRIGDLNEVAGDLRRLAEEHGVTPDYLVDVADVPQFSRSVHGWAHELFSDRAEDIAAFQREQAEDMQASRGMEVSGNRYEYLDVAVEQLAQASRATSTREVAQAWTIPQPQQAVFIQPQHAQQLAVESPEVQQDFGVSF